MKDKKLDTESGSLANSNFDLPDNANHLIKDVPRPKTAIYLDKVTVKPSEQKKIFLCSLDKNSVLKGFLVEVEPDPSPPNSVVTTVMNLSSGSKNTLFLHIANFSSKSIVAEVWRL